MAETRYLSPEYLRLQWDNFESNFKNALQDLREKRDYFDVTLACEDKQIEAHRLILSACSPFFRNILGRNPHQHTILYLKGVSYTHLVNIVDFMYRGHVDVAHDSLQDFLNIAEDLKVQGLSDATGPLAKRKLASSSESTHLAKRIKPVHKCSICLKDFVKKQHLEFHIEKQHQMENVEDEPGGGEEKEIMIKMEEPNDVTAENLQISEDTIISHPCCDAEEDNGCLSNMDYSYQISTLDDSAEEANWEDYEVIKNNANCKVNNENKNRNSKVQKDQHNDSSFPPHEFKILNKHSGKNKITLIVNGCFKFNERKFCNNTFYYECNFPKCIAKAIAIGERNDKNPTITRIDTVHSLNDGSGDIHVHCRGVILAEECRQRLRQIAITDLTTSCKQIYEVECAHFESELVGEIDKTEFRKNMATYKEIENSMSRWRKEFKPKTVSEMFKPNKSKLN